LLGLRRDLPSLQRLDKAATHAEFLGATDVLVIHRSHSRQPLIAVANLGRTTAQFPFPASSGTWNTVLDSYENRFGGPGKSMPSSIPDPVRTHLTLGGHQLSLFLRT
jgi:hypothetical protein